MSNKHICLRFLAFSQFNIVDVNIKNLKCKNSDFSDYCPWRDRINFRGFCKTTRLLGDFVLSTKHRNKEARNRNKGIDHGRNDGQENDEKNRKVIVAFRCQLERHVVLYADRISVITSKWGNIIAYYYINYEYYIKFCNYVPY